MVGDVGIGAEEPIRIQSMTTTRTSDTEATARQVAELASAGCEIVRVTVPSVAEAQSLEALRERLESLGVVVPLVADIHFNPAAALIAADFVEKVRVNPGNYADSKRFAVREYAEEEYAAEVERVRERFLPLVEKCARLGRAMRVGTNHGSLSDRIMNRYGDSPLGMVESALEFVRFARDAGYHDVVLSMKSSNPFVAIQAYRLLADRMAGEGLDHPFHLGVTEAGDGDDARIKSAIGIGSLLADGIGDTVRVSLTEDPVAEIPVARALVAPFDRLRGQPAQPEPAADLEDPREPHEYRRRESIELAVGERRLGGEHPVQVWLDLSPAGDGSALAERVRRHVAWEDGDDTRADVAHLSLRGTADLDALEAVRPALWNAAGRAALAVTVDAELALSEPAVERILAVAGLVLLRPRDAPDVGWAGGIGRVAARVRAAGASFGVSIGPAEVSPALAGRSSVEALARSAAEAVSVTAGAVRGMPLLAIEPDPRESPVHVYRLAWTLLAEQGHDAVPFLLVDRSASDPEAEPLLEGAARLGGLLADGMGDAVRIDGTDAETALARGFGILQATRLRMSRPDYIACPSCGRTLFDLEEVTARIKRATGHLKGVKIAIMGCIVNGPGEMADADFGYVGAAPGKINLYVQKTCVEKNLPTEEADRRLVELIKEHGRWVEPPVGSPAGGG